MKIYTRTGDAGQTSLFGGQRVGKDDLRVEAYGAVDECNAALGLAVSACSHADLQAQLQQLQRELFDLGADLATPNDSPGADRVRRVEPAAVERLEAAIDQATQELPSLTRFILPGGTHAASALHLARTLARRAERAAVRLEREEAINHQCVVYLNRLSDLLFTLARLANHRAGQAEPTW
ncbi:MAG: cob(I)yrinic acid a,c-diamide adenosyltransferase [Bacillota bacterium]